MMNAMAFLTPYKHEGVWVFDDPEVDLVKEPFVFGIDEMLSKLSKGIAGAEDGFTLIYSANPFPGYAIELIWKREDYGGNWYYCPQFEMEGWLCPALFKYFESAPEKLFAKAQEKT